MKLKSKIFTAVAIMFILPIVLCVVSVYFISNYQNMQTQSRYGFDSDTVQSIANPIRMLDWLTSSSFSDIQEYILNDTASLSNEEVLDEINSDMNSTYSFLAVRKNEEFVYVGDQKTFDKITTAFPRYIENAGEETQMTYLAGDFPCLVKQLNFKYEDGGQGSAFIVININKVIPQIKMLAIEVIVVFILIMALTSFVLISWIYKSILRPINKLSKASQRISCGDLDFSINIDKKDEVGNLSGDFENMRCRLKELIEAQQVYEKESRELISNISHDLKTPLTAIKGYSEGIMDGVADTDEKREKYIRTIFNKAVDMTVLVDELSLYSKLDGNMVPYDFHSINVIDYFTDCTDELSLDVEVKGIDFSYINECDKDTFIYMDGEQIKRVINNIIVNAVKYMDERPGKITMKLVEKNKYVQVSIADNGKGIAKKDLINIFDRFYRTDSSRNSAQGGTGLGLSIAKKIIERHGGRIWADSEEHVGTTIYFILPMDSSRIKASTSKKNKKRGYIRWSWYSGRRTQNTANKASTKISNNAKDKLTGTDMEEKHVEIDNKYNKKDKDIRKD